MIELDAPVILGTELYIEVVHILRLRSDVVGVGSPVLRHRRSFEPQESVVVRHPCLRVGTVLDDVTDVAVGDVAVKVVVAAGRIGGIVFPKGHRDGFFDIQYLDRACLRAIGAAGNFYGVGAGFEVQLCLAVLSCGHGRNTIPFPVPVGIIFSTDCGNNRFFHRFGFAVIHHIDLHIHGVINMGAYALSEAVGDGDVEVQQLFLLAELGDVPIPFQT